VGLSVYAPILARQLLGKHEELSEASFSMLSVSCQRKVGDQFPPKLLVVFSCV
jgi:hypothetical protein